MAATWGEGNRQCSMNAPIVTNFHANTTKNCVFFKCRNFTVGLHHVRSLFIVAHWMTMHSAHKGRWNTSSGRKKVHEHEAAKCKVSANIAIEHRLCFRAELLLCTKAIFINRPKQKKLICAGVSWHWLQRCIVYVDVGCCVRNCARKQWKKNVRVCIIRRDSDFELQATKCDAKEEEERKKQHKINSVAKI